MNPLTQVKRIQKITSTEAALGISDDASWHAKYKESAYVFVGGIPFDLTEGDLIAVFAQYGEVVDVNLVRDKGTGKSKGFAFLAYEDQRSTILAVDNLNGAKILGRIVRVDHVSNYKKKEEEDEEEEKRKREERGVCYAFQRGECNRGASCKFSHDEQRNANTGWGAKDGSSEWDHDKHEGPRTNFSKNTASQNPERTGKEGELKAKRTEESGRSSRSEDGDRSFGPRKYRQSFEDHHEIGGMKPRGDETEARDRDVHRRDKYSGRSRLVADKEDESEKRRGNEKRSRETSSSSGYDRDADKQRQRRGGQR